VKEWEDAVKEFAHHGKTALLIGDVDTGKTTFLKYMANYLSEKHLRVSIIDADIGQSTIGPPSTIGLATSEDRVESLENLPVKAIYFTGAISPVRHLLPCVIGTKKILDYAMSLSTDRIIIDTTGFVTEPAAVALKQAKIELLGPDFIFAFYRGKELEPVLYPYRYASFTLREIEINGNVRKKSPEFRSSERKRKFLNYFKYSIKLRINFHSTAISGINYIPGGTTLHSNEVRWLSSTLDFPVTWAEKTGDRLTIGLSHLCEPGNIHEIKNRYSVASVDILDPLMFLAGFFSANDECLSIGVITDFRPEKGFIEVLSPWAGNIEDIKRLHIGTYRLPEDIYEDVTDHARKGHN